MLKPPIGLTFEATYVALIILSCIVGIETGIIIALRSEFCSFGKLIRAVFGITSKSHNKTAKKHNKEKLTKNE